MKKPENNLSKNKKTVAIGNDAHKPSSKLIFREPRSGIVDPVGRRIADNARKFLNIETGHVRAVKVFSVFQALMPPMMREFADKGLKDEILHEIFFDRPADLPDFRSYIVVAKLPGVTDDEGRSAQTVIEDLFGLPPNKEQTIFTQELFWFEKELSDSDLNKIAAELLGNKLINRFEIGRGYPKMNFNPKVLLTSGNNFENIKLLDTDDGLIELSNSRLLALDLPEMKAIKEYFSDPENRRRRHILGLPDDPTDCEMEILAQTWSEHCKHKEFAAVIEFSDLETGKKTTIDSLFSTFIKGATQNIINSGSAPWLVKVFSDNAGAVKIDEDRLFIWKVETHNTPSALDPYGGALTGIVGNNRDPLGTGRGGARLLFNTDVLCFAPPDYRGGLFPGQLHPRKILYGVCRGIEDGGNKSGVPTINGSIVFDERFRGKPLVFCGTGAVMPASYQGKASWEKEIAGGDLIVMAGGRVGKDGIHGATFSSLEINENSPLSAVQIGSPITQKILSDFLEKACALGLVKCCTDNGAGGLSSSIGELAGISGGAVVDLEKVPLKYSGLKPWEIFLSESQERMTLVVEPENFRKLADLAADYETEISTIGHFNDSGYLDVNFTGSPVASISMNFLHDGVPRKTLQAEWKNPVLVRADLPEKIDYENILMRLMSSLNICSREEIIRKYDHEVKGRSIIKPLMGQAGKTPQDAAVMRFDFDTFSGVAVSNGICPRYGDLDAYEMSAGAFDEAVRQIIAVGGRLPGSDSQPHDFWSVNDNFCVPDSVYDATTNPDGKYKMAQLVKMCQALYDMSVFFGIPMTSGKDSMKNDFRYDKVKISVPPTVLYSMTAKIRDVRKTITSDFKFPNDLIFLVGKTYDELGGSEFLRLFDKIGDTVPKVRKNEAKSLYYKLMQAIESGIVGSCHDLSDGGLAVALVESAIGTGFGFDVTLPQDEIGVDAHLFAESHSRFVVTVSSENRDRFESILDGSCTYLGKVEAQDRAVFRDRSSILIKAEMKKLLKAWEAGFERK